MSASHKLLLSLPRDGAEVAKLGDRLLEEDAIHAEILDTTWALAYASCMLIVACKGHSSLEVITYSTN